MGISVVRNFRKDILLGVLLSASFCWAFWPVWWALIQVWTENDDYSHGFFILPVVAYLIWTKREGPQTLRINKSWLGGVAIIICSLLYLAGLLSQFRTLANVSLVFTIWSICVFFFGTKFLRLYAWELFLLLFMIPFPARWYASITLPLQLFVTTVGFHVIQFFGIPVLREGNILHLANTSLEVVNACSGLRSIMTIVVLAYIVSCMMLKTSSRRLLLIILAVPCAVFSNLIRVSVIALYAQQGNTNFVNGFGHTLLGLILFGLSLILLFLFGKGILCFLPEK